MADGSLALDIGWPGLQPDDVFLLKLQFRGVLNGDQALALRNELGEHIQERSLTGARASGDKNADAGPDRRLQNFQHLRGDTVGCQQLPGSQWRRSEPPDRERWTIQS